MQKKRRKREDSHSRKANQLMVYDSAYLLQKRLLSQTLKSQEHSLHLAVLATVLIRIQQFCWNTPILDSWKCSREKFSSFKQQQKNENSLNSKV